MKMDNNFIYGKDYKDYSKLVDDLLSKIGYRSPAEIKTVGYYKKYHLRNLVAVYDCETSNYVSPEGEKRPFVISEAMTFLNLENDKNVNVLFRSMPQFVKFISALAKRLGLYCAQQPYTKKDGTPSKDVFGNVIWNLENDVYLNIYVHNLPFDASFIMPLLNIFSCFSSSLHKPYYFTTTSGLRFVDTAVLTQNSLAGLGKKLTKFEVAKKVGDFNYDKIRKPSTKFTKKEEGYVVNDVLVLSAYMAEFAKNNYGGDLSKIPLTQTGIVRDFLKRASKGNWSTYLELYHDHILTKPLIMKTIEHFLQSSKKSNWYRKHFAQLSLKQQTNQLFKDFASHSFTKPAETTEVTGKMLKNTMKDCLSLLGQYHDYKYSYDSFKMMKRAYQGGFTHSNAAHTGHLLKNVRSFDFTSSYPTRILSQKFAASSPVPLSQKELLGLPKLISQAVDQNKLLKTLYIFDLTADHIELKNGTPDAYLSDYHTTGDNKFCTNGRVISADNVKLTTTSIDWEIISQLYNLENLKITAGYKFDQDYLPRYLTASTVYFYSNKTKLKHVKGREADYMRAKQMLNSCYGCMVSDLVRPEISYDNEQGWTKVDYYGKDENLSKKVFEHQSANSFLYYIWGVEVSAYARVALWRGILGVGDDYVYSDTDSLKVLNPKNHLKMVKAENTLITKQIKLCLNSAGMNEKLANPKDIKGNNHPLGVWDPDDGRYKYFKTLGAKRYMVINEDNSFGITIAGLSKKIGADYILRASGCHYHYNKVQLDSENINKLFKFFNTNMYIPAKFTGKLGSYYVDSYPAFTYQGEKIPAGGGCLLKPVDFTMMMTVSFEQILEMFAEGYVFGSTFEK